MLQKDNKIASQDDCKSLILFLYIGLAQVYWINIALCALLIFLETFFISE